MKTFQRPNQQQFFSRLGARQPYAGVCMLLACCLLALVTVAPARADHGSPDELLDAASFEQRLNQQVPSDLVFQDERGHSVKLGDYFGTKPTILVLGYYECPNLCSVVLNELVTQLRALRLDVGRQFDVITVSINPGETPTLAAAKKRTYIERYGRSGAAEGWHFLTGRANAIERLAEAVGFQYAYDAKQGQYSHPGGLMLLTPEGKIARYFYALQYSPTDLRLGLVESSANKIGSPIDKVLLRCYRYDPETGKYTLAVMNIVRLSSIAMTLLVGAFVIVMLRRERRLGSEQQGLDGLKPG